MNLREQFYRPDRAELLTNLQRSERRKRRIALSIATAIARAHVRAHGTESEVDLYHHRKGRRITVTTTMVIDVDDLFAGED